MSCGTSAIRPRKRCAWWLSIPPQDLFRGNGDASIRSTGPEDATARALHELELMLKHEITPDEIAAFLVEPLQGEGGVYLGETDYLQGAQALCQHI